MDIVLVLWGKLNSNRGEALFVSYTFQDRRHMLMQKLEDSARNFQKKRADARIRAKSKGA